MKNTMRAVASISMIAAAIGGVGVIAGGAAIAQPGPMSTGPFATEWDCINELKAHGVYDSYNCSYRENEGAFFAILQTHVPG